MTLRFGRCYLDVESIAIGNLALCVSIVMTQDCVVSINSEGVDRFFLDFLSMVAFVTDTQNQSQNRYPSFPVSDATHEVLNAFQKVLIPKLRWNSVSV